MQLLNSWPVDNFDLSLNISEPAEPSPPPSRSSPIGHNLVRQSTNHSHQVHHNSYGSDNNNMADQTFHTPSFGDEDFDLAPPSLGALQSAPQPVLMHQQRLSPSQQQQQQQQQHHPAQELPSPNAVSVTQQNETSAPAPQIASSMPHLDLNYGNRQMSSQMQHHQQQMQGPPQSYGPRPGEVMYMQPPPPPMPQQRLPHQIQMQMHNQQGHYDTNRYPNMTAMNNHHQQIAYNNQMHMMRPPQQMMHVHQQHQMAHHPIGPGSAGSGSPPTSNHTSSPGLETGSEDSDDCGPFSQMMGGMKRPSPEPMEPSPPHPTMQQQQQSVNIPAPNNSTTGKPAAGGKKAKVQKRKKKKDPNEPQKPVSAYALFFRDTQAAIKGQNPNASFGEVSKIVASMWDTLDADHKNIYKRKTEAAKKEYLKALAAYRASLVSKQAAADQSDSIYGNHQVSGLSVNNSSSGGHHQTQQHHMNSGSGGLSPLQKKSPLLTSLMEGGGQAGSMSPNSTGNNPNMYMNNGSNSPNSPPVHQGNNQGQMGQVWNSHPSMNSTNMGGQQSQNQQQGHMMNIIHSGGMGNGCRVDQPSSPMMAHQQQPNQTQQTTGNHDQQHQGNGTNSNQQQSSTTANTTNSPVSYTPNYLGGQQTNNSGGDGNSSVGGGGNRENYPPPSRPPSGGGTQVNQTENPAQQRCLRSGCNNPAVDSPDWDREYCSNDCVVSHCRDVFTTWVTARQDSAANVNYASVK